MKIAEYQQMMDYLTGPRERFRDGGRIGFKNGGKGNPGILREGRASKLSAEEKRFINERFNKTGKRFDKWWPTIGNANRQNYMKVFDRVELSKKELSKLKKKNLISASELDEILTKAGKKTGIIKDFIDDPAYQALKPKVIEGIYASQGPGKVRDTFFKKPNAQQIKNILALHTGKGGNQPALKSVTINAINNLIKDKPFVNFLKTWNEGDKIPDKTIKKIFSPKAAYNPNTIAKYAQILDGSIPFEGVKVNKKLAEKIKKGIKFEAGGTRGSWQQAARNIAINEFDKIFNPANKSKSFVSRQNAIKNKFLDYGLKGLSVDEVLAMRTGYTSGQSPYSIFSQVLTKKMNTAIKNQLDGQTSKRALKLQEAIKEYGVDSQQANKIRLEQKNYIKQFKINNPEFAKANLPEFSFKSPQEVLGEKRFSTLPKEAQIAMKKSFKEQKFTPDLGKNLKTQKELAQTFSTEKNALRYLALIGCPGKAKGGRIGFQEGTTPSAQCVRSGADIVNKGKFNKLSPGQRANLTQFLNRAAKIGRTVMKFGVIPEAIFVAGESLVRMGMGDTLSESLLRASDYLLPGNQTKMADKSKFERTVGPENALTIMRARDYKNAIQELADVEVNADIDIQQNMEDFTGISDQELTKIKEDRIKQATQNVKNKFVSEAVTDSASRLELEAQDIAGTNNIFKKIGVAARNAKVDDIEQIAAPGQQKKEIAPPMLTNKDLADVFITDDFLQRERDELGGAPELSKENVLNFYRAMKPEELQGQDNILNQQYFRTVFDDARRNSANQERFFGTQGDFFGGEVEGRRTPTNRFSDFKLGMYAGGGIAKLAGKSSGPAPEKGPTPQGLDFLIKRGR
jgi:hypothetical protein